MGKQPREQLPSTPSTPQQTTDPRCGAVQAGFGRPGAGSPTGTGPPEWSAADAGGIFIASTLYVQGHGMFLDSYTHAQGNMLGRAYNSLNVAASADEGLTSTVAGIFRFLESAFLIGLMYLFQNLFLGLLWIVYWICQAQYLWGYVGLSLLALLGPVFIPFLLFSQTDWLFWGWAKGLVQCAVHMIVSGAVFTFVAVLMVLPLNRLLGVDDPSAPTSFVGLGGSTSIETSGRTPAAASARRPTATSARTPRPTSGPPGLRPVGPRVLDRSGHGGTYFHRAKNPERLLDDCRQAVT